MQIRKQLRRNAIAFAADYQGECCSAELARITDRRRAVGPWNPECKSGYHGIHVRVRHKARPQSHGNATGQSKGGQGK